MLGQAVSPRFATSRLSPNERRQRIEAQLNEKFQTPKEIAKAADMAYDSVVHVLRDMVRSGEVEAARRGSNSAPLYRRTSNA